MNPIDRSTLEARHLAAFWFSSTFVLSTLVIGYIGPAMGLSAWHSIVAIILGVGFGALCIALHANQGPRLGLPQMLQSRAQFGRRGALLPMLVAWLVYLAFNVFNLTLASEALGSVLPGPTAQWPAIVLALAMLLAMRGHRLLYRVQRLLVYPLVAVFGVLTLAALLLLEADTAQRHVQFAWSSFFTQLSAAASYQVSYAVYMSDYSRHLPRSTAPRKVIGWTFVGAAVAAIWLMSLGALLASALPAPDAIGSLRTLGNRFLPGFGSLAMLVAVPPLVSIIALNIYSATLIGPSVPQRKARLIGIVTFSSAVYLCTLALPDNHLSSFNTFLSLMLYLLVPWSAINLIDYYVVRRPSDAEENWAWPGVLAYLLSLLCMLPFFAISGYQGPLAIALEDTDIAFVVGFASAALGYALLAWLSTRYARRPWARCNTTECSRRQRRRR